MKTINSLRSKLFALTLALMASVSSFAYNYHGDLLCYNVLTDSTVAVTGQSEYKTMPRYEYLPENLVIPSEVPLQGKAYKVVSIDQWAFYACTMLKSVTIPSSVTFIGLSAFQYCENLVNVDIPTSVTTVEGFAFSYTKWYDNLPDGEVYINNTLYRYKGTAPENTQIVVKDGTTRIAGFTFWNQSNIVAIELPQTLTNIEHGAFEGCTQLSSILIPKNVIFIDCSAFAKCTGLMEVICLAPTPPIAGVSANPSPSDWMFAGVDIANVRLYVPMESIELYRNADQWKDFGQILPIEPTSYKSQWCNQWNILEYNVSGMGIPEETWRYYLAEDITINGTTYTTVNRYWTADKTKCESVATIRFTENQKVYALLGDTEYLVYDFSVQVGDTIETIVGVNYGTMLQQLLVHQIDIAMPTGPKTITLYPICKMEDGECDDCDEDGHYLWECCPIEWIEGIGSTDGFLMGYPPCGHVGGIGHKLLCAYKDDELQYINELYQDDYGCEYNAGPFNENLLGTWRVVGGNEIISISDSIIVFKYLGLTQKYTASATQLTVERLWIPEEESYRWANCNYTLSNDTLWIDNFMPLLVATYPPTFGPITLVKVKNEDLFPTLWGLQRTTFYHYTECSDSYSSLTASNEIVTINDKPYLRFGKMFLREENNQVLIYSAAYDKDLVLYDWNLEVGDSISLLAMDYGVYPEYAVSVVDYRVIVDIDENGDLITDTIPTDKVVVDKISTITLLDGKEYKTWHLATGWAGGITYVEGIGILSEGYGGGDYLGLIRPEELPTCYYGDLLVCVSKNNKLLYQMDPVKMDELGAECLCDYDRGPRKDNAKNGKIGGRPTPTQWNMLEVETKEMDGTPTILRAETFSYTLENDSIIANNKTFYQLARQSTKDTAITKSFVGALHFGEDEDNRVYFLRDGVEYVLYDFTAELGDTIEIFAGINNYPQETTYTHVVTGKDTLENGACRMMLEVVFPEEIGSDLEQQHLQKIWLAGLGSIDGIVHNAAKRTSDAHAAPARSAHSSDTQTSIMLCAWREDSCLYTTNHPEYDTFGCVYNQDPTAVENLTSPSSYQKIIHEGTLLILHEGKVYNVIGIQIK